MRRQRVVVVGGGIIGCSVSLSLADADCDVQLLEIEDSLLSRSSQAGFGSLTPYSDPYFRGSARDFAARSVDLYRQRWLKTISERSGEGIDIGDKGLLDLLVDDDALGRVEALQEELVSAGYKAVLMTREDVLEIEPALRGDYVGALWLDEPWIDREQYFTALAVLLQRHRSVEVRFGATVSTVRAGADSVTVVVEPDVLITADFVVLCTGLSAQVVEGVELPRLTWVRGDAIAVVSPGGPPLLERHVYKQAAFITPRRDGRLFLGATYHAEELDATILDRIRRDRITVRQAMQLMAVNRELVPDIADLDIVQLWRGWRPKPADGFPVLGPAQNPRMVIATGFIGLGITMAPAVGEAIAHYVTNGTADMMPLEFSPARFGK
jgi:glycine/D-amino acid oxidase-like deaminating enzyme